MVGLKLIDKSGPDGEGLALLNREIEGCRLCTERGYVAVSRPIEHGHGRKRIWLIGQAPGLSEGERKMAFAGPAGRTLMRWFATAGLSEEQVRDYFYLSAINKCYPGRAPKGGGDRNPTPVERALCRPYLLREMALLQPRLVILVGSTSIKEVYGEKIRLEEIIGQRKVMTMGELHERLKIRLSKHKETAHHSHTSLHKGFDPAAALEVFHLPHPSGASTWLNQPENRARLTLALADLKEKFKEFT
jgi:uracil-DNA glycosylase